MILEQLRRTVRDRFLLGMISAVVLASLFPEIGSSRGPLRLGHLATAGIFLVFLLHGLGLAPENLKAGVMRWKLHVVVQAFTFVVFPILGLALRALVGDWIPPALMLGFLYLCALPSTISSSVALTAVARGNVPGAIFNATLSSLLGIVVTPFLVGLVSRLEGRGIPIGDAVVNIAMLLLLPFALGQALRPISGGWLARQAKRVHGFDRGVILLVVFTAFSDSVRAGLWTNYGASTLALAVAGAALLLAVVLSLAPRAAGWLGLGREDEIAAAFCGSTKGLAAGIPMAKLLFGAHPALGVIVLPIMFYHQLQLILCSILAQRWAHRAE